MRVLVGGLERLSVGGLWGEESWGEKGRRGRVVRGAVERVRGEVGIEGWRGGG